MSVKPTGGCAIANHLGVIICAGMRVRVWILLKYGKKIDSVSDQIRRVQGHIQQCAHHPRGPIHVEVLLHVGLGDCGALRRSRGSWKNCAQRRVVQVPVHRVRFARCRS